MPEHCKKYSHEMLPFYFLIIIFYSPNDTICVNIRFTKKDNICVYSCIRGSIKNTGCPLSLVQREWGNGKSISFTYSAWVAGDLILSRPYGTLNFHNILVYRYYVPTGLKD